MKANQFTLSRTAGLLAGAVLVLASARAAEADAFPSFENNYVKYSGTAAEVSGSKAAYQARTQNVKSGAVGIEEFRYGYELNKDTSLQIDGKAMPVQEDYLLKFTVAKNELGSIEAGYQTFRTFYDGAGGFFPKNDAFLPIYRRPLFVDRGKFFVNATLAMPKAPVFTFKYSNDTRTGRKDSTIWGDSDLTGIPIMTGPGASNPVSANRKILPAFIQLGERMETWEASMRHVVGNTTAVLSIGGDRINNLNTRSVDRYVGELRPFPAFSSPVLVAAPQNVTQNPQRGLDIQGFRENAWTASGRVETVISPTTTVFAGLSYHHGKESVTGSRLISVPFNSATGLQTLVGGFTPGGRPPYSYTSAGDLKQEILTGNVGVQLKPAADLFIEAALKGENYKDSGHVIANYVNNAIVLATGVVTPMPVAALPQDLDNVEKPWTPALDVRYTGIRNLALYGSFEHRRVAQDEKNNYGALSVNTGAGTVGGSVTAFANHIKERHSNATIGANWTPRGIFSARAELFTKDHENKFEGYATSTGSFYVLNYDIAGAKLSATVKPQPNLSLTTRYIVQQGKASTVEDGYAKTDANDAKRYQICEAISWNPNKNVYVLGNVNVVFDDMSTAYPRVTGTARDVIRNSENNYWNGDVTVGFAASKQADVLLQGTYYKADNFDAAQSYATLPLGASAKEYTLTAGVKYKIAPKTIASAKIGYFESKNPTLGGYGDFRGPLAYVTLEHAF